MSSIIPGEPTAVLIIYDSELSREPYNSDESFNISTIEDCNFILSHKL